MRDLTSRRMIWLKAWLFVILAVLSALGLLLQNPAATTLVFILVLAWAVSRLYYFLFYVLHAYVDPTLKYSGVISLLRELARRRLSRDAA
jgi:hypothetical protein